MNRKVVFGLVHGSSHGAWCWQRLIGALAVLGHVSVAMDLPCDEEGAGAERYAGTVVDALADVADDVVLVGHSLGGLTIPVVAFRRPIRKLIFLAAVIPSPGKSLRQQAEAEPMMLFPDQGPSSRRSQWYNATSDADAAWALAQIREQSETPSRELTPLVAWPEVDSAYIVPSDDRTVNPAWGRKAARERLGVEPHELAGADHSPFLSRPADLARLLVELAI
jgi:pimeloyl-ACP methyl ester carboxylesterase